MHPNNNKLCGIHFLIVHVEGVSDKDLTKTQKIIYSRGQGISSRVVKFKCG